MEVQMQIKALQKILLTIIATYSCVATFAQNNQTIIPAPVKLEMHTGNFFLKPGTSIKFNASQKEIQPVVNYFVGVIQKLSGISVAVNKSSVSQIELVIDKSIAKEAAYILEVKPTIVLIKAGGSSGLFYAIQSLLQTLPAVRTNDELLIPCMLVYDEPRFNWRGMHLDVSRHFFSTDVIKQFIDLLAAYKLNTFHWHLTEDQGWRIEIKKYPRLTSVGSKRNGTIIGKPPGFGNDNIPHSGYYTQQEIKEIVAYAKSRFVEVVPEIEMPGHGSAAIAAYPWLSCFPNQSTVIPPSILSEKSKRELKDGRIKLVQESWGVFNDVFCAGKDSTFTFLENVLDEVIKLFPSKYIHIGGDECPKAHWKKCPACQKRIKDLQLKDEHELQSYFIQRIEKYLNKNGKALIGWDEILEGGLAPAATVMSWRGEKGGIEAANMNHNVVMSPNSPYYFDHYQAGPEGEPLAIGGFNPLKKVYEYDPVPKSLPQEKHKYILGAQANVWTEYIATAEQLEYMILPRMLALAESVWSPSTNKNWQDFNQRLEYHFTAFGQKGLRYSPGNFTVDIKPVSNNGTLQVELACEVASATIHFTTNGTIPTASSPRYTTAIAINNTQTIKAVSIYNGKVMNLVPAEQTFILHKATGAAVSYAFPAAKTYPANGPNTLTDGIRGKTALNKNWHGFNKNDLVATIDLGTVTTISEISIGCLQRYREWVFLPKSVKFEVSTDGVTFREVSFVANDIPATETAVILKDFTAKFVSVAVRYVRVTAYTLDQCPQGHPGEGKPGWVFADEVIITNSN